MWVSRQLMRIIANLFPNRVATFGQYSSELQILIFPIKSKLLPE